MMFNRNAIIPILGLFFFLLAQASIYAQLKSGFRHYRKGRFEKAAKKLELSLKNPLQAPIAQLGLAYIERKKLLNADYSLIDSTYQFVRQAQKDFSQLPERLKRRYEKKKHIRVSKESFANYCGRLQSNALKIIEASDSILLLDTFMTYMMPVETSVKAYLTLVEDTVTVNNYFKAKDYEALKSVVTNHYAVLEKRALKMSETYEIRLKDAFLDEYPLTEYRNHVNNFPNIRYTADCHIDYFLESVESGQLESVASFLNFCKQSNLDEIVVDALAKTPSQFLLNQLEYLSGEEKDRIEEVIKTRDWLYSKNFDVVDGPNFVKQILFHLRDIAPSNRAYRLLILSLKYLQEKKAWESCLWLLQEAKLIFPDLAPEVCRQYAILNKTQVWFDKMIELFRVEAKFPKRNLLTTISKKDISQGSPVVSIDNRELLFSSKKAPQSKQAEDIFMAVNVGLSAEWSKTKRYINLSSKQRERPLAISADHTKLLVSINNRLYLSERKMPNDSWSEPKAFPKAFYDLMPWTGNATLSRDGKVIIFEGSYDKRPIINESNIDLYLMKYDEEKAVWTTPYPIASRLNSIYQERTPFLHADGRTLFFSSQAHYGLAKMDWFKSVRIGEGWDNWTTPQNMGKEHNSFEDDWTPQFSMLASGKSVYTDSGTETKDLVQQEISSIYRPTRMIVMNGRLIHIGENTQIKTFTTYPVQGVSAIDSCKVLPNKNFQLLVPDLGQERVYFYADDPLIYSSVASIDREDIQDVMTISSNPITRPIKDMIGLGLPIPTQHLLFEPASTQLSIEAKKELQWIANSFKKKKLLLLVSGYAFEEGSDEEERTLSEKRAEVIKCYLEESGLPASMLWAQGFGDRFPKTPKDLGKQAKRSRRVQIFVKSPNTLKH